jgi:hypothetical protein
MGSYNMPGLLAGKSPDTGETKIAIRRLAIVRTQQLHSYRDNRYPGTEPNMLLGRS